MDLDDHLVIHDTAIMLFATLCGAVGYILGESFTIGFLMAGSVAALGAIVMNVRPLRRTVNRLALAVTKGQ